MLHATMVFMLQQAREAFGGRKVWQTTMDVGIFQQEARDKTGAMIILQIWPKGRKDRMLLQQQQQQQLWQGTGAGAVAMEKGVAASTAVTPARYTLVNIKRIYACNF